MRDGQIIKLQANTSATVARLFQHIVSLDARQQAIERVLSSRRAFLGAILNPSSFWKSVNSVHQTLVRQHEQQMKEAIEEQKAEAAKPKIKLVRP